jgi:hypothetical protein
MQYDIGRLRRPEWLMGGGALAFFIFLFFFKWYGGSVSTPAGSISTGASSLNGWHTFSNSRWIWLITIIVALGAVAIVATQYQLKSPVQLSVIVAGLGALSVLLILYRIIHHPHGSESFGGATVSYGIKLGIWLGLIAAAVTTYGGYLAMRSEGTSLTDVREQASRVVSSAAAAASTPASPSSGESGGGGSSAPVTDAAPSSPPASAPPGGETPDPTGGEIPLPPPAS